MSIVIGLIVGLRLNAFIALITAAIAVSLMAPGELPEKITRVAMAFGSTAGGIGIVIALASVIGKCLMDSGAADRIVRAFLAILGEKRSSTALAGSGFILSVPVFFDTVFYLLVPLARSLYSRTNTHYLKYVMAISAGAIVAHTLVPPTPGPLLMADQLGIDIGTMMLVGAICGIPTVIVGLLFSGWIDKRMPIKMRPQIVSQQPDTKADAASEKSIEELPGLFVSLLIIVLPVLMITSNTVVSYLAGRAGTKGGIQALSEWTNLIGNPNIAMLASATIALLVFVRQCQPGKAGLTVAMEEALMSGGLIILITSAGGAFGAMLKAAQIGPAIQDLFSTGSQVGGFGLLFLGFGMASLLKFAQGSTTVAVITVSSMLAAMIGGIELAYNPVYLAVAIGGGGLVGSWMNDSAFWIVSKMSGLTEIEALKSWTVLLCILGCTAFIMSLVLSTILPL